VTDEGERHIHRTVGTGGSFGASPLRLEIGLGRAREVRSLEIAWPSRDRPIQSFPGVGLDQFIRIAEGGGPEVRRLEKLELRVVRERGAPP
jgi:hypothetical protein